MTSDVPTQPPDCAVRADGLASRLHRSGHPLAAAEWAIHLLCREGLLVPTYIPEQAPAVLTEGKCNPFGPGVSEHTMEAPPILESPPAGPVPYDRFRVRSTPSLWEQWRAGTGGGQTAAVPPATSGPPATQTDPGSEGWSRPYTVKALARVYNIGRNTMSKRLRDGQYRARKVGRTWQVAVADLPAGERQRQR
jgi:hypothetical protein